LPPLSFIAIPSVAQIEMPETGNKSELPTISLTDTTSVESGRQSAWTGRLPREIMTQILEILAIETKLGTLARCQEMCSAVYTLVTPILYRHITISEKGALKLLCPFQCISQSDRLLFLRAAPQIDHPIDMPLPNRLQFSLNHTRSLSLEMEDYDTDIQLVQDYVELAHALNYFGTLGLWPSLEQITLDLTRDPVSIGPIYSIPYRYNIIEAVIAGMQIKHLVVKLPDPVPASRRQTMNLWGQLMSNIKVDSIDIINYGDERYLWGPSVSKSFSIQFSESLEINPWGDLGLATNRLCPTAKTIKVFGIDEDAPEYRLRYEAMLYKDILGDRLAVGNEEDLKIGYVSKGQDEKDIVWRVLKAKDYKDE
jgi:hypothetical protein